MPFITSDDITEALLKTRQRGRKFLLSKLQIKGRKRTQSAFDDSALTHANWWIVPRVKERWNELITGDPSLEYKSYFINKYFKRSTQLKLLSLGSGYCGHELELASFPQFSSIHCVDLAQNRLDFAQQKALEMGYQRKMKFICTSIDDFDFQQGVYDIIFFHSAFHHFRDVGRLLRNKILPSLRDGGHILMNEYVGPARLQFPKAQIRAVNEALQLIPIDLRKRFRSKLFKKHISGSGLWRVILADPSESVDSASIVPELHLQTNVIEEKPYGGNILMLVLKDIAHHFIELDNEKEGVLKRLFDFEDEYLLHNPSDYLAGLYKKRG